MAYKICNILHYILDTVAFILFFICCFSVEYDKEDWLLTWCILFIICIVCYVSAKLLKDIYLTYAFIMSLLIWFIFYVIPRVLTKQQFDVILNMYVYYDGSISDMMNDLPYKYANHLHYIKRGEKPYEIE